MAIRRRGPIRVDGPLAPFADGLRGDLAGRGYAVDTVVDHVHLLASLSDWLSGRGLAVGELTTAVAEEFLRERRAGGHRVGVTSRGLAPVLGFLRREQAVPPHVEVAPVTPLDILLGEDEPGHGRAQDDDTARDRNAVRYNRVYERRNGLALVSAEGRSAPVSRSSTRAERLSVRPRTTPRGESLKSEAGRLPLLTQKAADHP